MSDDTPVVHLRRGAPGYPLALSRRADGDAPEVLALRGDPALLRQPLTALFCSVRVPDGLVLRVYDLARALRDRGVPTVGGFQSPMEKECLELLLRGRQPVVVSPARGIEPMRLPPAWQEALDDGRLLILSRFGEKRRRPTAAMAQARNRLVAALAARVFVPFAEPGGRTYRLAAEAIRRGTPVLTLDDPHNRDLLLLGARAADGVLPTG